MNTTIQNNAARDAGQPLPEVIEDRQVLHRADTKGDRICRVQRIRFNGVITTVNFWYSEAGQLIRVV